MSKECKTTEFSLHLSRSKMRKYLENTLSQSEQQEVELHLKHCSHCSGIIVEYVENEEPEHYKAHMNKLKGKLTNDVKPRKRGFTYGRIKLIRAAAAVAALFIFSFFALNTMVEKDFNLISKADKTETELPKLGANSKKTQKPKPSTPTLKEKKTDEIKDEVEMQEEEKEETPKVAVKKTKPAVSSQPKPAITKAEEEKEITQKKAIEKVEKTSTDNTLAEASDVQEENTPKEEKLADKTSEESEDVKEQAEAVQSIQPLQKIEKIDASTEKAVTPEAQDVQNIPSNSVGQLRQQ